MSGDLRTRTLGFARAYRYEVIGLAALTALIGTAVLLTAYLGRAFSDAVRVTATVPGNGAPLLVGAEVKLHGVPVGRVTGAEIRDGRNLLSIDLDRENADLIPAGVTARVLPATLFGLEYVDLAPPAEVQAYGIEPGTFIAPDLSAESVETTKLLADVYPILNTLQPAQLNATLTALASALEGRGDQLGATVAELDGYLEGIGPHVPQLLDDLRKLAELSGTLEQSAPDLLAFVRNAVVTGRTVAEQREEIAALVGAGSLGTDTVRGVLDENEQHLVTLTDRLQVTLDALGGSRDGVAAGVRALPPALDKLAAILSVQPALNVDVRLPSDSRCRYTPADRPSYPSDLRSPHSRDLDPQTCAAAQAPAAAPPIGPPPAATPGTATSGSAAEKQALQELLAPVLEVPADAVHDVTSLLFGPILRGGLLGSGG